MFVRDYIKDLGEIGMDVTGIITIPEKNKPHTVKRVDLKGWRINECCIMNSRNTDFSISLLELENMFFTVSYVLVNFETE